MIISFMLGAGVGYVLGTRAGRERYEQIARGYRRVADHPTVQGAAGVARAKAGEAVHTGVAKAREQFTGPHQPAAPGRATTNGTPPNPRHRATIVER